MTSEQQEAADHLRRLLGFGDRRIAAALGLTVGVVRWDREHRSDLPYPLDPPELRLV